MLLAFYFLLLVFFTFGPDLWIWHHFTEDSNLLIASVWFLPSLIIIASWFAVRKGFHHVAAVRLIFGGMLCFTFPKIAFILTYWFLGTQIAFYLALGIVACVLYGLIWGWRRVVVKNITIYSPDLPASFDGYRILQLSDFHVGTYPANTHFVGKVVDICNSLYCDLGVFTGDLVNNSPAEVNPYITDLKRLQCKDGFYSIWGNHDYCLTGNDRSEKNILAHQKELYRIESQLGWHQLMNEHVTLEKGGEHIQLIGVENAGAAPFPNKCNLQDAMGDIPLSDYKILLSHDPHHWRKEALQNDIQLMLAGHTHAGQLKIGKFTFARFAFKEWGGLYHHGHQHLYVSYGIGGSFPFRLGAWPEITVLTLKRKPSSR